MNKVRFALWIVVAVGILFWVIVGVHGTYTIAQLGGPVALWATTMFVVVVLLALAGSQINQQWLGVLIDNRNKFSLARLQIALWTVMVMSAYLIIAFARIVAMEKGDPTQAQAQALNITFPPELLLAMGISAASFAGSTLIKQTKTTKTMTIGERSTPESAEQRRQEAAATFEAAEAALVQKVAAEMKAKAEVDKATAAEETAASGPAKEAARKQVRMAQTLYESAVQDKMVATKDRADKEKELDAAEKDLAAITEAQGRLHRNADPSEASWVDLFRGEEISNFKLVDMSKVQMMFFTIVVVAVYAAAIVALLGGDLQNKDGLSFPEFGDTLNALLGISHGTYLSVKAVDHS